VFDQTRPVWCDEAVMGDPALPAPPAADSLAAMANEPHPTARQWTRAGHALQKHGYRQGSSFPRVAGPPARYNEAARTIVVQLLTDPTTTFEVRWKRSYGVDRPYLFVIAADGRSISYRWEETIGTFVFVGFREPGRSGER